MQTRPRPPRPRARAKARARRPRRRARKKRHACMLAFPDLLNPHGGSPIEPSRCLLMLLASRCFDLGFAEGRRRKALRRYHVQVEIRRGLCNTLSNHRLNLGLCVKRAQSRLASGCESQLLSFVNRVRCWFHLRSGLPATLWVSRDLSRLNPETRFSMCCVFIPLRAARGVQGAPLLRQARRQLPVARVHAPPRHRVLGPLQGRNPISRTLIRVSLRL